MSVFTRMGKKLRSQRGDSMVESLAAILIAVLGATALAAMVTVSVNMSISNENALRQSYEAQSGMGNSSGGTATIALGGKSSSIDVTVYQSNDGSFFRYEPQANAPGA